MTVSALPVLLPMAVLVFALLTVAAGLWRAGVAYTLALAGSAGGLALAVAGLAAVGTHGEVRHDLGGWPPPIGIEYVLDPLSAYMATIVAVITLVVVVYPAREGFGLQPDRRTPIYGLVLLLEAGLLGVLMSGDLFNLFVFLEVYAIATYALVTLGGDRAVFATLRYLLIGTIGSGFYLLGVGFVYFSTGSLNMADVAARLPELAGSPTLAGAAVLIVVGLGIKMALFPLHVWLPDAHSYAPPAVAALLAAVQVKVGAYALVRILFGVFPPDVAAGGLPVATALAWCGAAGVVVGSVMAVRQTDFKRLLAYSTVAQLGFIAIGIGLANPLALVGALLHIASHALVKCCLFLVAGGIIEGTGVKQVTGFAGLGRRMPWTMAGFALAAAAMVGVPPTSGFWSKWYLVLGSLEAGDWALAVVIVASSLLSAAYFLRVIEQVFTGEPVERRVAEATEPQGRVVVPVLVLAVGALAVGLANVAIVREVLDPAAIRLLGAG